MNPHIPLRQWLVAAAAAVTLTLMPAAAWAGDDDGRPAAHLRSVRADRHHDHDHHSSHRGHHFDHHDHHDHLFHHHSRHSHHDLLHHRSHLDIHSRHGHTDFGIHLHLGSPSYSYYRSYRSYPYSYSSQYRHYDWLNDSYRARSYSSYDLSYDRLYPRIYDSRGDSTIIIDRPSTTTIIRPGPTIVVPRTHVGCTPGHWTNQWVPPVTRTIVDSQGLSSTRIVESGYWQRTWTPGQCLHPGEAGVCPSTVRVEP